MLIRKDSVKMLTDVVYTFSLLYSWIRNWSHIATHFLLVVGATSSKKPKAPLFQIGSGWKFAEMLTTK